VLTWAQQMLTDYYSPAADLSGLRKGLNRCSAGLGVIPGDAVVSFLTAAFSARRIRPAADTFEIQSMTSVARQRWALLRRDRFGLHISKTSRAGAVRACRSYREAN